MKTAEDGITDGTMKDGTTAILLNFDEQLFEAFKTNTYSISGNNVLKSVQLN